MIDLFKLWIRNIAIFFIFASFVELILPNESFRKYIKLVLGFIMMIILISPITYLLKTPNPFDSLILNNNIKIEKNTYKNSKITYEETQKNLIIKSYKSQLNEQIKTVLQPIKNLQILHISIDINENMEEKDFGEIQKMQLIVCLNEEDKAQQSIFIEPVEKVKIRKEGDEISSPPKDMETILLEKKIKNLLVNFYNMSSDNIYITVQKKS